MCDELVATEFIGAQRAWNQNPVDIGEGIAVQDGVGELVDCTAR